MNENKVKLSGFRFKYVILIILVIILNAIVALISISCYKNYNENADTRRIKHCISENIVNEETLAGLSFEYEFEYVLDNNEKRIISGVDNYYWNGHKLVPVTDFIKGFD